MKKSFMDFSYLAVARIVLKGMGLVSVVIFTRLLLKEEIAIIPIFALLGRLSMVMFSFGVLPCLVKELPSLVSNKDQKGVNAYIKTCLYLVIPGIALFSAGCYMLSDWLAKIIFEDQSFGNYLRLMTIGIFFNGVSQLFSYIYWGLSRFRSESKRMILVAFVKVVSGIGLVLLLGIKGLIISLILTSFLNFVIYTYDLRQVIFTSSSFYSLKGILKESWPFYLESYLMYFRAEGDQLIVTTFLGAEALAVYYIAKRPFELLRTFTQSLDRVLTSSLASFKGQEDKFNERLNQLISLNTYLLVPVIFLAAGCTPVFITLIAGPGYEDAIFPAIGLLFTLLVQFYWNSTFGRSIFILSSSANRFKMTLIESGLLIVLVFIFGSIFGLTGVVTGRLVATLITGMVSYMLVRNLITLELAYSNLLIVSGWSVLMSLILLLGQYLSDNLILIGLAGVISVLSFLTGISFTISNQYYATIGKLVPFKVKDPLKFVIRKLS